MKVALIGNMNNNNFSIMRYFRDLGIDAHLILMVNDITESQTHFAPEYDTWEIEKWKPYIHYLNYKSSRAVVYYPGFLLKKGFKGYDIYIGSALIPAILKKCGIRLDLFYPYSTGIERVGTQQIRAGNKDKNLYSRLLSKYLRRLSISALKNTRVCLSIDLSLTKQTFDELCIPFQKIPIPMVYNKEIVEFSNISNKLMNYIQIINQYDIKFLCHLRHDGYFHNHITYIEGFAKFVKQVKDKKVILVLFEYGQRVDKTKELIHNLGIQEYVLWIQKSSRKEITFILDYVDLGFNDFIGLHWGGTGWEFLSKGVPFFHYLDMSPEQFQEEYDVPMPPFINTNSPDEICDHLIKYTENPEPYKKKGAEIKDWFEKYGGIGLAERWANVIIQIYEEKRNAYHQQN